MMYHTTNGRFFMFGLHHTPMVEASTTGTWACTKSYGARGEPHLGSRTAREGISGSQFLRSRRTNENPPRRGEGFRSCVRAVVRHIRCSFCSSARNVNSRSFRRVRLVFTQDFTCHRCRIPLTEKYVADEVHERIAFSPSEVAVRDLVVGIPQVQ